MSDKQSSKKFIKRLTAMVLIILVLIGVVVFAFDPFYHYHKPWFGMKAVLNDKEYQCIGTLRNFDYVSIISVARLFLSRRFLTCSVKIATSRSVWRPANTADERRRAVASSNADNS